MLNKLVASGLPAVALVGAVLVIAGCGQNDSATTPQAEGPSASDASASLEGLFLDSAPEGVRSISALKESAEPGEEVVVRAVVGGRVTPIVEGRASASMVDAKLENICVSEDDHCATPWDYCCAPREALTENLATLQVVDEQGRVLSADLSERLSPLSTLVVKGTVGPRPDPKVLTVNATGIYVEPLEAP